MQTLINKRLFFVVAWMVVVVGIQAQTVHEEIMKDVRCSAGSFAFYPAPPDDCLTPAPEGKRPFSISHYGSHGARYHNNSEMYDAPWAVLASADSAGCLTTLGRDVLHRLEVIRQDATERWGELTDKGAQQQRDVMRRMIERFPEVFTDDASVEGRSTSTTRCILSMENALLQAALMRPLLFRQNASQRDMHYMSLQIRRIFSLRLDRRSQALYNAFEKKYADFERLLGSLFSDTAYVRQHVDGSQFCRDLFRVASNIQSTELRDRLTLYDVFTPEELYRLWKCQNAWDYVNNGAVTTNGGQKPFSQSNLVRKMIEMADTAFLSPHPSAELRFGESDGIIPLACLLEVGGYGLATDDLESLDSLGWADYRISPMGANLQLVFYRKDAADDDIWVKVLLNERETTLPLPTDHAPYYHWRDFREYYIKKIEDYEKR